MKQIFIERREKILRVAVKNNNKLEECFIEEENNEPKSGEIYKGIVKNIVPAIKCAFIDIGYSKNCYMYLDRKFNNIHIKKNDEILVEVLKEAIDEKGPKVTNAITIPGRYVVLETLNNGLSFSKKIENNIFKKYIKEHVMKPKDIGIMIRTNGEKVSVDIINEEIERLYQIYCNIVNDCRYSIKPKFLYDGNGIVNKILRDIVDSDTELIVVDREKDYNYIKEFLQFSPDINCKLKIHTENKTIFNYYGIEREILELRNKRISLKSGGNIVIDKTEGMYVIDVNSAKDVKSVSIKDTALNTNIEAAYEIVRQIKLRNLGGIIIIDFIDIDNKVDKDNILNILNQCMKLEKNKTVIYPFTELNLVQIARKRTGKSITEYIEEKCNICNGRGKRISYFYLTHLINNEITGLCKELNVENIYIEISNIYKEDIMCDVNSFANKIGSNNRSIYVKFSENLELFRVEALVFSNHIEKMQKYKIYG
ncbi:ribonuclease E/G [Clostridium sp. SYSU_GA19001]|uniref:Rne/Rng family ribonuclease n=1 Tax=Clostridium caldaquaticum TaxID=2940653 RepID=UPI0020774F33|nr:ribonuclease E/G [Clostridium caldaquaticum]MCM8710378.1 ribonuclease E/G [Clostridium caldaquaticum]